MNDVVGTAAKLAHATVDNANLCGGAAVLLQISRSRGDRRHGREDAGAGDLGHAGAGASRPAGTITSASTNLCIC